MSRALLCLLLLGCAGGPTEILVTLEADEAALARIDAAWIEIDARAAGGSETRADVDLGAAAPFPAPLLLVYRDRGALGPITLRGVGAEAGARLVEVTETVSYVPGERVAVTLRLEGACLGVSCGADERCVDGRCVAPLPGDGGLGDAGPGDAGPSRCEDGWADCDGRAENGCEVELATDEAHCGACDAACAPTNAIGECVAGECTIVRCESDLYTDCNGLVGDGCEVQLQTDTGNCGACGNRCSFPSATPECAGGTCGIRRCNGEARRDCNGELDDGCEVDVRRDAMNCGGCGVVCAASGPRVAGAFCDDEECAFTCEPGWDDCDESPGNGCEVQTATDPVNCGSCGSGCSSGERCVDGRCAP